MDNEDLKNKWPELKEKLQKEHPHLSAEDLKYEIGKEEELLKRLVKKTGKTQKEIENWLSILG